MRAMNSGRLMAVLGMALAGLGIVVWLLSRGLRLPGGLAWPDYLLIGAVARWELGYLFQ